MSIQQAVEQVRANIARAAQGAGRDPAEVTLVAATKTQSSDTIRAAIAAGITVAKTGSRSSPPIWPTGPTRGRPSILSATCRPTR